MNKRLAFGIFGVLLILVITIAVLSFTGQDEKVEEKEVIPKNEFTKLLKQRGIELTQESEALYSFGSFDLHNGDLILLHEEDQVGLNLTTGQNVLIDLTFIPDGTTSQTAVGYFFDGEFIQLTSEPITDKLITHFNIEEDGNYIICIIGYNANFITLTEGSISIDD